MKQKQLDMLFQTHKTKELGFSGHCHNCKCDVDVIAKLSDDGQITIDGGAVYKPFEGEEQFYLKCDTCFEKDTVLRNYREVDTYSRVVGYLRPTSNWNDAKQEEFKQRKNYRCMEQAIV